MSELHFMQFYCRQRKKIFLFYFAVLSVFSYRSLSGYIPDYISVERGREVCVGKYLPVTNTLKMGEETVESFGMLSTETCGTYQMQCRLLGLIPVKDVTVNIVEESTVIPGGVPIGIYVQTNGILVVDTAELQTESDTVMSPSRHILRSGDYIVAVDHSAVTEKEELVHAVQNSAGNALLISIIRDGEPMDLSIVPARCKEGDYRIGAWIRDDMAGVGTLTYLTADGSFGALGHSISDTDTESVVELKSGTAYAVDIVDVIRGEKGNPGELVGQIQYDKNHELGTILENSANGIFGSMYTLPDELAEARPLAVGYKQDIEIGSAQILVELDGELGSYEIEIENVDMTPSTPNKGIRLRITDEDLIAKTGGIIQGLSGSPILQNGKIIGGVTHVFVSDPLEGYGIFIEDMLQN